MEAAKVRRADAGLAEAVSRFSRPMLIVGILGLATSVPALTSKPEMFYRSYLLAFVFWNGLAVGSLAVLMLQYLTGGAWGIAIRRPLEAAARTIPLCALFFVPIIFGMHSLYEWTHADVVAKDEVLRHKAFYLNTPFFIVRAAIAYGAWFLVTHFLTKLSARQDALGDHASIDRSLQKLSGAGLVIYALTVTWT